jgi:hypothetical protein
LLPCTFRGFQIGGIRAPRRTGHPDLMILRKFEGEFEDSDGVGA